ncbi:MAG: hypothetical protein QGI83_00175, partial [Candidatus Latescibacteria bacterium]|nr:hypothetical protein [Candidatus Latescibacterota bacterium]
MSKNDVRTLNRSQQHVSLPDGATIVVVGGGPAGAFFAIQAAKKARVLGRKLDLLIVEKKEELRFYQAASSIPLREGCNYCAGGISPMLASALRESGLSVPEEIVLGRATSLTVHGDWKSIELPVPEGREMLSVFRGSRPRHRAGRHVNFDSYLLDKAVEEGARVVAGEVQDVGYSPSLKPVVRYRTGTGGKNGIETTEADFVVFAGGVNQTPGMDPESDRLFGALKKAIPGFRPPKVRKTLICEMQTEEELLRHIRGEVHFAQYGSKDLQIEMSSLMPKGGWITVVLLGRTVDRAQPSQHLQIMERFLELPHIKRLLPRKATLAPVCVCNPNMVVGASRSPFGHRVALIGDMAVSRLYKDGIFSAYASARGLADCILDVGIDRASLKKAYWPVIRRFEVDNRFGAVVFLLNRVTFSHRVLSRIFYQAVLTERKTKPEHGRRLADVLWRIASGDDTYRSILLSMYHPATVWSIVVGGALVTIRNCMTERVFGLNWEGFGRYPTGVPREDIEEKRLEIAGVLGIQPTRRSLDFERMYSIKIKAGRARILDQLGRFGDADRRYFRSRLVNVHRTVGSANQVGSTIQYDVFPGWLSFSVVLEKVVGTHYLLYRVRDGFAQGGILVFSIDEKEEGLCLLSIYVAF